MSTLSSPSPSSPTWGPRRPGGRAWPTMPSPSCTLRSSSRSLPRTSWSSPRPAWTRPAGVTASRSPCCRSPGPRPGPRPPRRSPWSPSRGRAATTASTGGTAAGTWSPSTWATWSWWCLYFLPFSCQESARGSNRSIPKSHEEISMDCLTVPVPNNNLLQPSQPRRMSRKMSPRQNSLPARPSSARGASPTSGTRSQGLLRGGSFNRPAKQGHSSCVYYCWWI